MTHPAGRWAQIWKDGWEQLSAEPIIALYAADALLSTEPFRQPYTGQRGVRDYVTRVFSEETDPRVEVSEPIIDGDRAAVSWWASLREEGVETTLAGTSVLHFNADGLVVQQWDTWNVVRERRDPPTGWGLFL